LAHPALGEGENTVSRAYNLGRPLDQSFRIGGQAVGFGLQLSDGHFVVLQRSFGVKPVAASTAAAISSVTFICTAGTGNRKFARHAGADRNCLSKALKRNKPKGLEFPSSP
jgi:hypothetical protein